MEMDLQFDANVFGAYGTLLNVYAAMAGRA
jgi:hypothetical protein